MKSLARTRFAKLGTALTVVAQVVGPNLWSPGVARASAAHIYSQDWESGSGGWFTTKGGEVVLVQDVDAPSPPTAQQISRVAAGGDYFSPLIQLSGGQPYCFSASINWLGGGWPFVGFDNFDAEGSPLGETWVIGQENYPAGFSEEDAGTVTPVPESAAGWHRYQKTVVVSANTTQVRLKDELYDYVDKPGDDLGLFDDLTIETGECEPQLSYIAFGDSIASGEGVEPFDNYPGDDGDHWCHRSEYAYARQLAQSHEMQLQHVACSGATIGKINSYPQVKDTLGPSNEEVPPQVEQVTGLEKADLVTVTVGVNSIRTKHVSVGWDKQVGWSTIIRACHGFGDCRPDFPDLAKDIRRIEEGLTQMYVRLARSTGSAHVAVVGYPHYFADPDSGSYSACAGFSRKELRWLRARWQDASDTVWDAVRAARARQSSGSTISYVRTLDAFEGHERCSTNPERKRWVHGVVKSHREFSFHPKREGQTALTKVLEDHLELQRGLL